MSKAGLLLLLSLALTCPSRSFSTESSPAPTPSSRSEPTNSQETLRAYLQLQEQLHATQLAIEQTRKESGEAAAQSAQVLAVRLQAIEQALASQRLHEMEVVQSSNHSLLLVAASFGLLGLLTLLLMAYFQWRTVNRLAEISVALPPARGLLPGPGTGELGTGERRLLSGGSVEQANQRLVGALERLEGRIHELERTSKPPLKAPLGREGEPKAIPASSPGKGEAMAPRHGRSMVAGTEPAPEVAPADLLTKGQAYLNQDQAEAALACFEAALKVAPAHSEALLKKGVALEHLRRFEEALAYYDRALAADATLTIAHLHKGGLFTRMERFEEALACYEQAQRTQDKRVA